MKTLFILRHAEAAPSSGSGDFERLLTDNGHEAAKALGEAMVEKNYIPTIALCSAAVRTTQTLEGVMEAVKISTVQRSRDIYHATMQDLLSIIQSIDDKHDSALIVGHNPTVHETAASLAADDMPQLVAKLAGSYRPATLSVFHIAHASWQDLQPGENRLIDILN